jgi:peptidoglycan biosynthesis protein MviN/MurJ (putative lipid II flippase)
VAYAKTLVALLTAVLAAVLPALTNHAGLLPDGHLGASGVANIVVLGAAAVQVFSAPNTPGWRWAKTIAAAVAAGGVVLISALTDADVGAAEWVQIGMAVLGALGVYAVPNALTSDGVFIAGRHARALGVAADGTRLAP